MPVVCRVRRHRKFLNKDKQSHGDAPDTIYLKSCYTIIVGRSETAGCFLNYCHLVRRHEIVDIIQGLIMATHPTKTNLMW